MLIILSVILITIICSEREEIVILTVGTRVPLGEVTECWGIYLDRLFSWGKVRLQGHEETEKISNLLSLSNTQNSGLGERTGKKETGKKVWWSIRKDDNMTGGHID